MRIGGGAIADADLQGAALLGLGAHRLHEHRIGGRGGKASGERQLNKVTTRNLAFRGKLGGRLQLQFEFRHFLVSPSDPDGERACPRGNEEAHPLTRWAGNLPCSFLFLFSYSVAGQRVSARGGS